MARPPVKHALAGLAMLIAAGLAVGAVPRQELADRKPAVNLQSLVPDKFGGWSLDNTMAPVRSDPAVQDTVEKTYTQVLSRTYVNGHGDRVMLSVAYARVSYDALSTHVPEVCYPSQGFRLHQLRPGRLSTGFGDIPVKRLVASRWSRTEPITYWTVVGDRAVAGGWPWRLAQIEYGLKGIIPDNMLVRVSSIDTDTPRAFTIQKRFVGALLRTLDLQGRTRLIGIVKTG